MDSAKIIAELEKIVRAFAEDEETFCAPDYNEHNTRQRFINKLFGKEILGWDILNDEGKSERFKDVEEEDKIRVGGTMKAPDYAFRIGGVRMFFVEAKKPSITIKNNSEYSFQLRSYAWSAKLPVGILTNFKEFAVYDTRVKPNKSDKASVARTDYWTYNEYVEKWADIESKFSKKAVEQGKFDKYIERGKGKRGTTEVDDDFLRLIERWRGDLAKHIAPRNPSLGAHEVTEAVQLIIDRIIFLRISEDRGIMIDNRLETLMNFENVYERLLKMFVQADEIFNSGLFHFQTEKGRGNSDEFTTKLSIDDWVFRNIIKDLYYPSPYVFDVIPADILGQVYEQFLGKVIRLTPSHQVKIEDKPEVKKAGGVYYTPTYIVEYIVKNTVGRLLENSTPKKAESIRILDPACGSGSFLIGAYQYLLDWHLAWYTANDPEKWTTGKNPPIFATHSQSASLPHSTSPLPLGEGQGEGIQDNNNNNFLQGENENPALSNLRPRPLRERAAATPVAAGEGNFKKSYRLTTAARKRILLNNIYGVDIDPQAVETTKLSLLLKVLEGETQASLTAQLRLALHDRALPDLDENIKCGNSLIGPDFYTGENFDMFDDEEKYRINAFDWNKNFPEIMQNGGFDAVIGNPPYLGGREWKEENARPYNYIVERYNVAEYQFDIYVLFWEKGITLLKINGLIGYITPNTWLNNQSCMKLRDFILRNTAVQNIVDYSRIKVFSKAVVLPIVTILKNTNEITNDINILLPNNGKIITTNLISQSIWVNDQNKIFNINLEKGDVELRDKIEKSGVPLESLSIVKFGIKLYETGKGLPPQKPIAATNHIYESKNKIDKTYRKYLEGKDVNRYNIEWKSRWLKYGDNLAAPRDPILFEGDRLLIRRIVGIRLIGTFTNENYVTSQLLQIVKPFEGTNAKYLLGILNSLLLAFYFKKKYNRQDKTFPEIRVYELASLPIRTINIIDPADRARHDRMVALVERMLALHKQLPQEKSPGAKTRLEREIEQTDAMIDALVYELYGLTEEEVKMVEVTYL